MIQVAYADDHELVRKGTISLLASEDIRFVMEAENGLDMVNQLELTDTLPDICMVDIRMPEMDGFELLSQLKERWPQMGVLVLTAYKSDWNVIRMVKAGANGYLLKNSSPSEIKKALHDIYTTGYYFTELMSDKLHQSVQQLKPSAISFTNREMEFLRHCCSDLSYDQIAAEMNISPRTIHGYCERIFAKFGVNSRIGLVLIALKSGILP